MSLPHPNRLTGSVQPIRAVVMHTLPHVNRADPDLVALMLQDREFIEEKRASGRYEARRQ